MPSPASANRDGLSQAIGVFRTAMRPFIVRAMRRIPHRRVETVISGSLNDRRSAEFDRAVGMGESAEDAIDVNDFPHLALRNWRETFSAEFGDDRAVQNALWLIADARNKVAHPAQRDMELPYVQSRALLIAEMLGRINCPDEKREVETIAARLAAPSAAPAADSPSTEPGGDARARRRVARVAGVENGHAAQGNRYAGRIHRIRIRRRPPASPRRSRRRHRLRQPRRILQPDLHHPRHPRPAGERPQAHWRERRRPRHTDQNRFRRRQNPQPHRALPPNRQRGRPHQPRPRRQRISANRARHPRHHERSRLRPGHRRARQNRRAGRDFPRRDG